MTRAGKRRSLFEGASPSEGFPAIARLPWSTDPTGARLGAYKLLTEEGGISCKLSTWLKSLDSSQVDYIVEHSLERPSHYKWLLGGNRRSYLVWLHQYRPPEEFARADRFAASVHDHRLWFTSRVISGALHVSWYGVEVCGETASLTVIRRQRLSVDMAVQMKPEEIHRIDRVEGKTLTLLIQGPAEQHFSTVYNLSDGSMIRKYDLDALYPRLVAEIGAGE